MDGAIDASAMEADEDDVENNDEDEDADEDVAARVVLTVDSEPATGKNSKAFKTFTVV
jgi:hypothetical protein